MHSQNGSAAPPIAGHTTMRRGWRPALRRKKTGLETRATGGRVVRSGPARGGWNRPSRCREPGEDAQPKRQRRPTNRRPHDNATGLETRATEEEDGPGDPCYGGRKRAWRPVLRGVGWCGAGQPAADGIALRAAGSRVKMHSQNGSARPTNRRPHDNATGLETRATGEGTGLETRPTGEENGPGDPSYGG
jgi:hypothetical protein